MKISKQVSRRLQAVLTLVAALRNPPAGLLERLKEILGEELPGGSKCFELLADRLLRQMDRLKALDRDKVIAEFDASTAGRRRRKAADRLYSLVVSTRDSVAGAFGRREGRELIALEGRVSRQLDELFAQAITVGRYLDILIADDERMRRSHLSFDPEFLARDLRTASTDLDTAEEELVGPQQTLDLSRLAWKRAMAELDHDCRSALQIAKGWYRLARYEHRLPSYRDAIRKRAYTKKKREPEVAV